MTTEAIIQALIDRLKRQHPDLPDQFYGFTSAAPGGDIADGDYGDMDRDPRPDFVREDTRGWVSIQSLRR